MADQLGFNEEFQTTILAYLWKTKGAIANYTNSLPPSCFDSVVNAALWGLMADFYKSYKAAPSRSVLLDLVGCAYDKDAEDDRRKKLACAERISDLEEADISGGKYIETRIREFLRFSALKEFVFEAVTGLKDNKFDPDLPKKARQALSKGEEIFDAGLEWRDGVYARIAEEVRTENISRVPTGITHFDAEIGGGLRGGELGILLAVPKGFKSGTMLNFAYGAMRADLYRSDDKLNTNVLYVTLELSQSLVSSRFDRRCSLLPRDELVRDPEAYVDRLDYMMRTVCSNSRLFIKGWKTKSATADTFRAYLDRMWDEHGIKFGVIFIDYLDLVKGGSGGAKRHDAASLADSAALITEDIRDLAIEYNVPIWTACRATREAVGKTHLSMQHMSKSFERVGVADCVAALCQSDEEKVNGELRIALMAMRNDAGDKQIHCRVDYPLMKLVSTGVSDIVYEEDVKKAKKKASTDDKFLSKIKERKAMKDVDD